ncbi:hypothetical protein [Streptomyces sp. NPDC060031]|uniref:flagellin N-terminal helical domain-containing protein n=1 Tax=Streptomyces sp. NPDC060031 TaxID=3347043 RepID=UPI0036A8CDBA
MTDDLSTTAEGSRSASDAISFIQTTEGHLNELTNTLQRMRVLSIQSANGTYSQEDRSAIQIEVDQLTDEIARIADQADFNKMRMLTDASGEANVRAADELGMIPAKINTPASLANAQAAWTLRVHVGANTNEALAVNVFAANINHLFAGEAAAPADQGAAEPEARAATVGPVNVLTAIDANSSIAKIDVAIRAVTDQQVHYAAARTELTALSPDDALLVLPTGTPDESGIVMIPASEVKPTDKAALALENQEGRPVLTVSSGTVLPEQLAVRDTDGNLLATYVAAPVIQPRGVRGLESVLQTYQYPLQ